MKLEQVVGILQTGSFHKDNKKTCPEQDLNLISLFAILLYFHFMQNNNLII